MTAEFQQPLLQSSVSDGPPEIIEAQETLPIIINVENGCGA